MRAALLLGLALLAAPPLAGPARGAGEVWHATRALQPGDVLGAQDIEALAPRRAAPGQVEAERDILGLEVKRRLRAGVALTERDIGERQAVRAAQPVRVFWKRNGVSLELEGRALEAGAIGEQIRVHNPQSGRTIRALVVAEGTAEVRGAP
ncbi:flagellar basal body P-ring formation chaperone FlgA [Teichococcus cervicalis]|uniref:flagellar basal body P-ring formation chaperone FlgA n=1 Tax=Teichococcus cervicalis TaxID=204525 RepID=UPI0002FADE51|nr:flagellar basal body P-ring formation chaperone FlgA [Pseudoroseomonas cervicalis]